MVGSLSAATIFACFLLFPESLRAADYPQPLIAKATHIILADSRATEPHPKDVALVHAGTPLLAFPETLIIDSIKRRLVLTSTGLWGYITDDKTHHYWDPLIDHPFTEARDIIVIRDYHTLKSEIGPDTTILKTISPNQAFAYLGETDDGYKVRIEISKAHGEASFLVPKAITGRIGLDQMPNSDAEIKEFTLSTFDGVAGISKECDTSSVRATEIGGGLGFSLEKFFGFFKLELGVEVKQVTSYEGNVSVRRRYYTREDASGFYRITEIQDCKTNKKFVRFVDRDNEEIAFNVEFIKEHRMIQDGSGLVRVSCPRELLQFEEAIRKRGRFREEDIPFIVSRTARAVEYGSLACSEIPKEG